MKTIRIKVSDRTLLGAEVSKAKSELINKVIELVKSKGFINYMAERIKKQLDIIAEEQVSTINNEALDATGEEKRRYLSSMNVEIVDNTITFFNDSVINLSEKTLKPATRARYPLKLSLAQIIEYGIGYVGATSSAPSSAEDTTPDNWEYDVRGHGYKGWYYVDSAGNVHWTNGLAGRYVFLRLKWWVEENAKEIITDYINKNI